MAIRVVRLGSPRADKEGLRIGTVRRPPRGVPKTEYAAQDWYDVWYPNLAPSVESMKLAQEAQKTEDAGQWAEFRRRYRAEMATPENRHSIALLAAMSHRSHFSVGCYCEQEARCHRSLLRELLDEAGAEVVKA